MYLTAGAPFSLHRVAFAGIGDVYVGLYTLAILSLLQFQSEIFGPLGCLVETQGFATSELG